METEVSALKTAFSINNDWFEYSTIVVLAGLVFELVTLLAFHKTASWREKSILIAGTLIIAIGVAGEWHFGSKASSAALRLQTISDEKVAALGKLAADARERAAKAELELKKFRAPRTLTSDQRDGISEKLRPFAGTEFDAATNVQDNEQAQLLILLMGVLTKSGWKHVDWTYASGPGITYKFGAGQGSPNIGSTASYDVEIQARQESLARLKPAAEALVYALREIGITAHAVGSDATTINNANIQALHLIVGQKQ